MWKCLCADKGAAGTSHGVTFIPDLEEVDALLAVARRGTGPRSMCRGIVQQQRGQDQARPDDGW